MRQILLALALLASAWSAPLTGNKITADGTYTVTTTPGKRYVFSASGTFGSGSLAINWTDSAGTSTAFANSPATAAETWTFTAPTSTVSLVLSGSTNPSITVGITPAGNSIDVDISELSQSGAATGSIAKWNGTTWNATQSHGVIVRKADGSWTAYAPSADTDAARGLALESAMAAAVAGDTVDLSPGNYDVAKATSTVIAVATHYQILAGMTIRLNGARLYHGAAFNGAVMFGADAVDGWSIIGPGIIEGTAATSSGAAEIGINNRTCRRWLIENVTVRYFKGTGIQVNSSSYTSGDYSTGKVSTGRISNCNIDLNNIGYGNYAGSEYNALVNCTFNKNLTGCDIYAGNTRFSNCEANYNTNYALRIRDGGNDGHGMWTGGSINHNLAFAIAVEASMDNGFVFSGANLYADSNTTNKIQSLGGGLVFSGCIIDSPFYASSTPTGINLVVGTHFPLSVVTAAQAVTDLSSAERLKWLFENNVTNSGGYANNDYQVYTYADNTAALAGGLTAGRHYKTSTGQVMTVY